MSKYLCDYCEVVEMVTQGLCDECTVSAPKIVLQLVNTADVLNQKEK